MQDLHEGVVFLDVDDADVFGRYAVDPADGADQIAGAQLPALPGKDAQLHLFCAQGVFPFLFFGQGLRQLIMPLRIGDPLWIVQAGEIGAQLTVDFLIAGRGEGKAAPSASMRALRPTRWM